MDEQEIRKWAWEFVASSIYANPGLTSKLTVGDCFKHADVLAAWVMSGKLPERLS